MLDLAPNAGSHVSRHRHMCSTQGYVLSPTTLPHRKRMPPSRHALQGHKEEDTCKTWGVPLPTSARRGHGHR